MNYVSVAVDLLRFFFLSVCLMRRLAGAHTHAQCSMFIVVHACSERLQFQDAHVSRSQIARRVPDAVRSVPHQANQSWKSKREKKRRKNRRQSGHVSKVDESRNNANMCSVHMDGVEDHMLAEHNDISENDKKLHRRRAFPGNIEYLALITRALQHRFHGVLLRTLEIVQCSFCTICAPHIHTYSSWWTFTNRIQELVERRVRF